MFLLALALGSTCLVVLDYSIEAFILFENRLALVPFSMASMFTASRSQAWSWAIVMEAAKSFLFSIIVLKFSERLIVLFCVQVMFDILNFYGPLWPPEVKLFWWCWTGFSKYFLDYWAAMFSRENLSLLLLTSNVFKFFFFSWNFSNWTLPILT